MRNAMQLKAIVKNISKEKKISAQLVLQIHMRAGAPDRVDMSNLWARFKTNKL